jgi:long-subunit fatty acid transport protein
MRKLSLAVSISALSVIPSLSQADIYDARSMGRGGAALTMGEYNQAIINPALINKFDENDDFSFALNVGVFASDKDGMIESLDDVQDGLDSIENNPQIGDSQRLFDLMGTIDSKLVQADVGTSILIGIPNKSLPVAFVVKGKASIGAQFTRDAGDLAILQQIEANTPGVTQSDLQSSMTASAVSVVEAGLMFGYKVSNLELGATFKAQEIELYSYSETVADADAADAIDEDQFKTSNSGFNVDLGATMRLGENSQYVVAGTIENLIPQTFDGPLNQVTLAADRIRDEASASPPPWVTTMAWVKAEANVDLTERSGYDLLKDTQFARVGLEFSAGRHLHLRTGYRADTEGQCLQRDHRRHRHHPMGPL